MKCPAVTCLWPRSSPSHRITAVTILLHHPPKLFTGGSDGSIVCWHLSSRNVRPLALLCGHTSEIADLISSSPYAVERDSSNSLSSSLHPFELISACVDGVLCSWNSTSFRCRQRRKLPPWAGTPSRLFAFPSSRHVCIICRSTESSKSSMIIVDSSTLLVVQTVVHSDLQIGCVETIAFIPLMKEKEMGNQAVFLIDTYGKAQLLDFSIVPGHDVERSSSLNLDSLTYIWGESNVTDGVHSVEVANDGNFLALLYEFRCEFRSILNGSVIGELSFTGTNHDNEESLVNLNVTGGLFLYWDGSDSVFESRLSEEDPLRIFYFAIFSSNGHAMVYKISMSNTVFDFQPLCEVPAKSLNTLGGASFYFCQLNDSLIRLESISFSIGDFLIWKPVIAIWSIFEFELIKKEHGSLSLSTLIGEGGFPDIHLFRPIEKVDRALSDSTQQSESFDYVNHDSVRSRMADNGLILKDSAISSSMLLSDDFNYQYAIVYGFYNGEIEVSGLLNPSLNPDSLNHPILRATKHLFSGHNGAVLCLAATYMSKSSGSFNLHRILVSGSMDCTVRIWDMDSESVLMVLHHHMAPVKQIILPPAWTDRPWNDCFLSVGEDGCVALISLETLRVERMFPGHPTCPSVVAWDTRRGYLACFCRSVLTISDSVAVVYIWDVKTGSREKVIHGSASYSLLDHFCRGINSNIYNGSITGGTTSASPLLFPASDNSVLSQSRVVKSDAKAMQTQRKYSDFSESMKNNNKGNLHPMSMIHETNSDSDLNSSVRKDTIHDIRQVKKHPIICSCPFPGIASLEFNLSSMALLQYSQNSKEQAIPEPSDNARNQSFQNEPSEDITVAQRDRSNISKEALEGYLLRFSLCFLHLWDIDLELDNLIMKEMGICKPDAFQIACGLMGDRGSMTLMFPGQFASLELWKTSSEFCAMRSLIIVSIAQHMIHLYHSTAFAGSALAAFYTRNFAERVQEIQPPLLQLLVCFWQDPSEYVRMAARSLFHCAVPRAIPPPFYNLKTVFNNATPNSVNAEDPIHSGKDLISPSGHISFEQSIETSSNGDCEIVSWLESFENHEWSSSIGLTTQDAMTSRIIVAAAFVVWYPSKVKESLANLTAVRLINLLMSMNERFSLTAIELLAEGMESSWKLCLGTEIPCLIGDIFSQIERLSSTPASTIRESLVGILLPKLATADISGFLKQIEDQIWSTSSDSPVHLVSLKTLIRILRTSPKLIALFLAKVVNYVLQTMDLSNLVMRRTCLNSSLITLKEIARVLPMVALNESSTRLAVGDAIGDIHNLTISVYDLESVIKMKILDASCPLGLPTSLEGTSNTKLATAISAVRFSPDGEGLVAFSENGLLLRWWPLGTHWWAKLSRNLVPVQCTKLIFVPPWEGFSPNSSRSSIMAGIVGIDKPPDFMENSTELNEADKAKLLLHSLDFSYRVQWVDGRNVILTRHGQELGTFLLRS